MTSLLQVLNSYPSTKPTVNDLGNDGTLVYERQPSAAASSSLLLDAKGLFLLMTYSRSRIHSFTLRSPGNFAKTEDGLIVRDV